MATPIDEKIDQTVDKSIKDALASFRAKESEARQTRTSVLTMDNVVEGMVPYVTSFFSASLKLIIPDILAQVKDIVSASGHNIDNSIKEQKVNTDRVETHIRQDNIILIGHEEPSSNYTTSGRETTDELENVLIDVGNKIGVTIDKNHISDAFRIGKRPVNSDGSPKLRHNGSKVCRPILFKLLKRSTKTALLQQKKTLRETHRIKIGEDITPMRKALCDFANDNGHSESRITSRGCTKTISLICDF